MPDPESTSWLGNNEDDNSATDGTITPTPGFPNPSQSSSSSTIHNINVNYSHSYSVTRTNGDEIDLPTLLQSLTQHITVQSPGKTLISAKPTDETSEEVMKSKRRKLVLENLEKPLFFTALDISDPPHLKYSDDLDSLVKDWDNSSYLIIKSVPIPLKYWSRVYRWARPSAWDVIKNNWSHWKVLPSSLFPPFGNYENLNLMEY